MSIEVDHMPRKDPALDWSITVRAERIPAGDGPNWVPAPKCNPRKRTISFWMPCNRLLRFKVQIHAGNQKAYFVALLEFTHLIFLGMDDFKGTRVQLLSDANGRTLPSNERVEVRMSQLVNAAKGARLIEFGLAGPDPAADLRQELEQLEQKLNGTFESEAELLECERRAAWLRDRIDQINKELSVNVAP